MELELKDLIYAGIFVAYHLFAAAVGSMEAPKENDTRSYRFWFSFLNKVAANWSRAKVLGNGNSGTMYGQVPPKLEPPKENK